MLIILSIIAYVALGGFAGGIAHSLNRERIDSFVMFLLIMFAPLTAIYVIGHTTALLGMRFASFCKK